jgi:hypothetical protein
VAEAKAGVEKKWTMPDKWEGPFCPRCWTGQNDDRPMKTRESTKGTPRPIFECDSGCGLAKYGDDATLIWTKKAFDFFALNKEFSTK